MDNTANRKKQYKFNVTDVFLIAVIAVAAAVLFYIVAETGLLGGGDEFYIYYTIDIPILRNELLDGVNRMSPGDRITDSVRGNDIGEIQQVRVSQAFVNSTNRERGIVERVIHPDHSRVQIDVRARAQYNSPRYTVNGQTIMKGIQIFFRTRHFTGHGNCTALEIAEIGAGADAGDGEGDGEGENS